MDTLFALETGNNILGTSLLDNFIIPYHNAATFQTACFQLQRNNRKHATVIWQFKKLRLCMRKRARSMKTCWHLIFDSSNRSLQQWVLQIWKPISNIIWVWINDVRLLLSNQLQVTNLKKYKNTHNLTIWNSKNQTKQANISFRQKHATVIWQSNKLRNMCERERQQKTWKPTDRFLLRPISCIIKVSVDSFGLLLIRVRWCCELMLLGYCYTNHR